MQRFFISWPLGIDMILRDDEIIHQISRVLRAKCGEHIVLFDGDGSETEYEITEITKKSITLRWIERRFPKTETDKSITLIQALPNKYEKIEYILQKWVEIGIQRFIFFKSERSQNLVVSPSKETRFHLIAKEAVEQCGWVNIPEILFLEKWWIDACIWYSQDNRVHVTLDTTGTKYPKDFILAKNISLWIGPEGGWSEIERHKMKEYWFITARFWERIFRTETAGIVVGFLFLYT